MKRKALALAFISMLVLTACSSGSQTAETTEAAATAADETTPSKSSSVREADKITLRLSWWGGDARHEATIAAVELYESTHPGVDIEMEYSSWDGYMDKILTQLAGGTQPDIMQIQATKAPELEQSFPGTFVNLDQQDIFDITPYDEKMMESFCASYGGYKVAVPTGANCYNLLVNKTVTDAAGIELPANMTWEEFFEYGKQIHAANPDYYMISLNDDNSNHMFRSYIRQLSGQWQIAEDGTVITDRDALVKAFTFLQDMFIEGVAEPMETAFAYNNDIGANPKFLNNEIATCYCAAAAIANLDTSAWTGGIDVINIPMVEGTDTTGIISQPTAVWMISDNEKKEAALDFMNWITSDEEAVKILKDSRGIPATDSGVALLESEGLLNPTVVKAASLALPIADDPVPVYCEHALVYDYLFPMIQELAYIQITPEDAADQVIENLNTIMAEVLQ